MAICIITNCRGYAPSSDPFCAKHRDKPQPAEVEQVGDGALREAIARIVKGARLSAAFGREFRAGDGRLDDVDLDAADTILALPRSGREG